MSCRVKTVPHPPWYRPRSESGLISGSPRGTPGSTTTTVVTSLFGYLPRGLLSPVRRSRDQVDGGSGSPGEGPGMNLEDVNGVSPSHPKR